MSIPVEIRGGRYPSISAAADAMGVAAHTVSKARRRGTLHRVGTGSRGPEALPVRIRGIDFENAAAAAEYFGVTAVSIRRAVCRGRPDRVGVAGPIRPNGARPFKVGNLEFPSQRAAAKALGFRHAYISQALRSGSTRAWERIVAAAMAEEARRAGMDRRKAA